MKKSAIDLEFETQLSNALGDRPLVERYMQQGVRQSRLPFGLRTDLSSRQKARQQRNNSLICKRSDAARQDVSS